RGRLGPDDREPPVKPRDMPPAEAAREYQPRGPIASVQHLQAGLPVTPLRALGRIYQGAKTCRQTVHVVPPTRDVDGQGEMSLVESSAAVGGAGDQQVRAIARLV